MITRFSIITLLIFLLSAFFVIFPVSFPIPFIARRRVSINLTTAPVLAIAILWAARCIDGNVIRDGIVGTDDIKPYNILILFISLAYMAITLDITGVLQAAAFWVSNKGGSNTRKLFLYFYVMLTLLSVLLGNDPVILSGTAFLVYYTTAAGLEPMPWLISEFAAANTASMVLFVGNPTNVVICEGFGVNNAAFTAYTILPFIACNVACYVALAFQFRDAKYLPRKIPVTAQLNVRGALRDPVGAWVGSILLGICLMAIVVLSFLKVDVWMISLPFAMTKFIFDIAWDHYRHVTGRLKKQIEGVEESEDPMASAIRQAMSIPADIENNSTFTSNTTDTVSSDSSPPKKLVKPGLSPPPDQISTFAKPSTYLDNMHASLARHFPTFFSALPRLPLPLIPFAFAQFILIEGLEHQGLIHLFANWLVKITKGNTYPTIWIIGLIGVLLCNFAGTNIGATILLTKVVRAAPGFSPQSTRAAAVSLAVASNIGAVSFTFSASLAGLLWKSILDQKSIEIGQGKFAFWNILPLAVMTAVGLAVVCAEVAVLY